MKSSYSKAQMGIFVAVSAILVLVLIFLISFNTDAIPVFSDEKSSTRVKEFVDSCIELQTQDAVKKIGISGGWLYSPPNILTNRDQPEQFNKRATALHFLERVEIPYWFYYDDASEEFLFNIPEYDTDNKYSMKNQIKRYVDENIERNCIQGFSQFNDLYTINYDPSEMEVEVEMADDIRVDLELPLEIIEKNSNNTEYVSNFNGEVENKLWIPYNLAKDITISQSQNSFVEKRILQFLNPYQTSSNRDFLPPFYDFKMTYDFQPWIIPDVETRIRQIVNAHIGKIQFLNTDYEVNELSEGMEQYEFARKLNEIYTKDYLSEYTNTSEEEPRIFAQYSNYRVRPSYEPFFPSSISIYPALGDQVLLPRPEAVVGLIPFFFTEYTSVYEITMPIVFEIAPNDENDRFIFNLAVESNIDHNSPLAENYEVNFNISDLQSQYTQSLVCDPPQFISDYVSLNITDPIAKGTRGPQDPTTGVDNAMITFDCKGISSCFVGQTSINAEDEDGNLTALKFRLPISCDPGRIEVYKYGHQKLVIENVNPTLDGPIDLGEMYMPSSKKLKLDVSLLSASASQYAQGGTLGPHDSGFLIFEHLENEDFVQAIELTPENQYDLEIELMPGNYSISGFVIYNQSVNIPSEQICYDGGCQTLPSMELESWISGGLELERFEVTTKRLLNSEKLTVNLVKVTTPSSYDSLSATSDSLGRLKELSVSREPYFD